MGFCYRRKASGDEEFFLLVHREAFVHVRLGFFDDDAGIDEHRFRVEGRVYYAASVCFGYLDNLFRVSGVVGTAVCFGVEGKIPESCKCFFGAG